jgi:hypothetical protein
MIGKASVFVVAIVATPTPAKETQSGEYKSYHNTSSCYTNYEWER